MAATPKYIYSDGTTVTFKLLGPQKTAIITYGSSFGEGDFEIIAGNTDEGATSFSAGFELLAEEIIIGYNSNRASSLLPAVTLVGVDSPPEVTPPVPPTSPLPPNPQLGEKENPDLPITSDNQGKFLVTSSSLSLDEIVKASTPAPLLSEVKIKKEGYETVTVPTQKGDGSYKEDLGIIKLTPTQQQLELEKLRLSQLSIPEIEFMSLEKKDWKYFLQDQLDTQIINIKKTLIPMVIGMIAAFGIAKATEMLGEKLDDLKSCPNQDKIKEIIKRKNKLVKVLNDILQLVEKTLVAAGITQGVVSALDIALQILKNTPIPPMGDQSGTITQQKNVNTPKVEKILELTKKISSNILPVLVVLRQNLVLVLDLLKMLDGLIQDCSPEAEQEQVAFELTELTVDNSNQSPVVTNVNGFEMGVETEKNSGTLKRRRAIARNKQGIVMLKGEYSFSSIDQILIDELVFYIQTNDLKAD